MIFITVDYVQFELFSDYVPTSRIVQQIQWSIEFFSREEETFANNSTTETEGLSLDYQLLNQDKALHEVWPQFNEDLYNDPSNTLAVLSLALHQVTCY